MPKPESLTMGQGAAFSKARALILAAVDAVVDVMGDTPEGNEIAIPLTGAAAELEKQRGAPSAASAAHELRGVLVLLQQSSHPALDGAAEGVARALAVLHPLEALMISGAVPHEAESVSADDAIPLSRPKKKKPKESSKTEHGPDDRRSRERVKVQVDIGYQSATNFFAAYSTDLSDGGLFIATHKLLPVGTNLSVSFVLPDGYHVISEATVAWVRDPRDRLGDVSPGMGVRLTRLSRVDHEAILRFMADRPPDFYDV